MRDLAKRLFRHMGKAELARTDRTRISGRGLAVRQKENGDGCTGEVPHVLGGLETPLAVFFGDLPAASAGDVLTVNGVSYTVLNAADLCAGRKRFCLRAVLERREERNDGT